MKIERGVCMKMKKETIIKLMGILLLAVSVAITTPSGRTTDALSVGILQLIEHASLDAVRDGFIEGLAANGFENGNQIELTYLNAQGDQSNLRVMSQQLVSNHADLIFAIATPSAQAVANATNEIPVLTGAVTDLVSANLVESNEIPNTNVSGTSDMTPVEKQLDLLLQLAPNTQTLGFLYNSSEANSQIQVEIAEEYARKLGLKTERMTVTNTNDVTQNMIALIQRVDAIYIPTDNTLASAMPNVGAIAREYQIPVITGAIEMAVEGGLATVGIDYYQLGKQAADMAIRVFNGEDISQMSVELASEAHIVINEEMALAIGLTLPDELQNIKE